jgi:hypothetical protein
MWFNDVTHAAYNDGIALANRDSGYRALRIDKTEHNNKIDDEIIADTTLKILDRTSPVRRKKYAAVSTSKRALRWD